MSIDPIKAEQFQEVIDLVCEAETYVLITQNPDGEAGLVWSGDLDVAGAILRGTQRAFDDRLLGIFEDEDEIDGHPYDDE